MTTWRDLLARRMGTEWTQRGLADALTTAGVKTSQQAVARWLSGSSTPSDDRWGALVSLLGITEPELLEVTGVKAALTQGAV